ncbi:hypothetical protein LINPERHAP1_LOCUS43648 [Linum perenne]
MVLHYLHMALFFLVVIGKNLLNQSFGLIIN